GEAWGWRAAGAGAGAPPGDGRAGALVAAWTLVVAAPVALSAFLLWPVPPASDRYFVRSPSVDRLSEPLRIGQGDDEGFFGGLVDEVRIFSAPRGEAAIRADMMQPIAATPRADKDLVAAYGFDAGTGAVLRDDSGRGHDGHIHGASWVESGRFGRALSFDGRSSEVIIPPASDFDLRQGLTLEAWVFPRGRLPRWPGVVSRGNFYLLASSDTGPYIAAGGGLFGGSNIRVRATEPIRERAWTHLATTYDGQTLRLYVNGELENVRDWWSSHQPADVVLNGIALPYATIVPEGPVRSALLQEVN